MASSFLNQSVSRREFLKSAAAISLAAPLAACASSVLPPSRTPSPPRSTPIRHVIVSMQENRSFDHYYGTAKFAGQFGVPAGYSVPDGNGGRVAPYHLALRESPDIRHSWKAIHAEYNDGAMDGFFVADGELALGHYTAADLPYYYGLFDTSTLCANYFCSVLGPTYPNRLYLIGGTSGGLTTNGPHGLGPGLGALDYPIILDLLETAHVTWKVYNVGSESANNPFYFFRKWLKDPRVSSTKEQYLRDLRDGTLPSVSYIIPGFLDHQDEHPPSDVRVGMELQQELITALQQSSAWSGAVYIVTYDEAGGFFDHVRPPQVDAFGLGFRVPTWVISPHAKAKHLEAALYDHTSVLKFLQTVFGLPTLASLNHRFDSSTPQGNDYDSQGAPAPPRDGRSDIGNLMDCLMLPVTA